MLSQVLNVGGLDKIIEEEGGIYSSVEHIEEFKKKSSQAIIMEGTGGGTDDEYNDILVGNGTTKIVNESDENIEGQDKEVNKNSRIHPVPGYSNTENMWEKIWNLDKPDLATNRYPNHLSEYFLHASEKLLKVKKNPLYKDHRKPKEEEKPNEEVKPATNGDTVKPDAK